MITIDKQWVEKNIDSDGKVVIPDGVKKIEPGAFENNENVKKVEMPDSVTEIGESAFCGCTNLEDIKFGENIKNIGDEAFLDCNALKKVQLPKNIEQIGEATFARCEELEKVLIDYEAKIKELKDSIFYECKKLKEVSIPESVEKIEDHAFCDCSSLEKISIPDTVKEINSNAFSYCSKLRNIEFGKNSQLTKLGDDAFKLCKELEEIKLPDGLKVLENGTFAGCYKLSSVDLGKGIEELKFDVFNSCKSLEKISLPETLNKIGVCAFINCKKLKEVIGGENVNEIQTAAFEDAGLEKYSVPKNVKKIDYQTFGNCTNLKEFYLGENVEELGSLALGGCTNLKKLSLNDKVSYIPETALEGVDNLEEIEINGTDKINYETFKGKDSIKKITIDGNEYLLGENEKLFSIQKNNKKVAIVVENEKGEKNSKCINLENGKEANVSSNIYIANDGKICRAINSIAGASIEALQEAKEKGEKRIYICGATRDIKPEENESGIEYDLYDIDDLIQIKNTINEIKKDIVIPPKDEKDRQKKIYSQLVERLSEKIEYDFYEEYMNDSSKEEKEYEKVKYEKMTGKKWEEYLKQNEDVDILKTRLEDGNLCGLINGRAVCRGNVEIIRNLAAEYGIEVTTIIGHKHTWNQVKLDEVWYDDDFTNYQTYLAQGNLNKASKRFLCGQENDESVFSKSKLYSKTLNKAKDVGKNYSMEEKTDLLKYGREQKKENQQNIDQIEKERKQQELIRDEIGDEFKPKTEEEKQEEQQLNTNIVAQKEENLEQELEDENKVITENEIGKATINMETRRKDMAKIKMQEDLQKIQEQQMNK